MTFSGHFGERKIVLAIVTLIVFAKIAAILQVFKNLVRMSCDILRTERVKTITKTMCHFIYYFTIIGNPLNCIFCVLYCVLLIIDFIFSFR